MSRAVVTGRSGSSGPRSRPLPGTSTGTPPPVPSSPRSRRLDPGGSNSRPRARSTTGGRWRCGVLGASGRALGAQKTRPVLTTGKRLVRASSFGRDQAVSPGGPALPTPGRTCEHNPAAYRPDGSIGEVGGDRSFQDLRTVAPARRHRGNSLHGPITSQGKPGPSPVASLARYPFIHGPATNHASLSQELIRGEAAARLEAARILRVFGGRYGYSRGYTSLSCR